MQAKYCEKHQRSACIVDLDLSQLVCERCALFDPLYSTHKFIDLESLPQHAIKLYRQFQKDIASLNITVDKDAVSNWRIIDQLAIEIFKQKSKQINATYDEMVAEIERQRKESMANLQQKINRIVSESNHSVNYLVRQKYHQLYCKNKYLDQCIKEKKYLQVTNELLDKAAKSIIGEIDKELSIIEIDLRHKFKTLDCSELPDLASRRTTFGKDEMLLPQQDKNNQIQIDFDVNTEKIIINEHCKTQTTFANPETDRVSTRPSLHIKNKSVDLDAQPNEFSTPQHSIDLTNLQMTSSLILPNNKNTKQLSNKSELKTIVLKNTIKQVNMTNLQLNNRQALDGIRKCTFGTFVNRIDLSGNELTSQLLVLLKKQKIHSKYLKTLVVKGMKVDERVLKKQGFNIEKISQGKVHLGEILIELV